VDEFRAAARVFWVSYSAWTRACPIYERERLLKSVSDDSKDEWHKKKDFRLVWQEEYDRVIDYYVSKVMEYANKFMETPAGHALLVQIEQSKKRKTCRPVIDEETLKAYKGEPGVDWRMSDVYDFFNLLSEVAETREFETSFETSVCIREY
jgi:hypothetical protein